MGILDDAIREHLELKRSHGASDDEIKRKEVEAFGAVRQETPAAEPSEAPQDEHTQLLTAEQPLATDEPGLADLEPLQPAPEDPYEVHPGDDLVPDPEVPESPAQPAHDPHHHDEQHPALVDHDHIGGEEHPPEPVFGHSAEAPTVPPPVEEPPVIEPVEEPEIDVPEIEPHEVPEIDEPEPVAHESEEDDDEEDVLEETPEFLQDAPEHDRLWFEQKPPRDFDFGE